MGGAPGGGNFRPNLPQPPATNQPLIHGPPPMGGPGPRPAMVRPQGGNTMPGSGGSGPDSAQDVVQSL